MRYICTSIVATLALAGMSFAATINVPADYSTIQAAVNAAVDGDEVVVAPGVYTSGTNYADLH
jgi:pectin methylesterase-like acyl-CoA thioesterase